MLTNPLTHTQQKIPSCHASDHRGVVLEIASFLFYCNLTDLATLEPNGIQGYFDKYSTGTVLTGFLLLYKKPTVYGHGQCFILKYVIMLLKYHLKE